MTSWWCAGGEPYTACGLFEGNLDDNAPESPSKTTHIELEFVELPKREGVKLSIGALELEVGMETAPCERMDEQHQGLTAALQPDWRGGVACRVLNDAEIRIGDPVAVKG